MLRDSLEDKALRGLLSLLLGLPRAVGFLTIIPIPKAIWRFSVPTDFVLVWFPVVGLFIGLAVYGTMAVFDHSSLGPVVGLALWALITGGLHLDGLGDVLDGLARRGTPKERKEVLKDPHIGSVGAAGLTVFLLLKYGALSAAPWGVMVAPVVGRSATVISMCLFPYGRPGERTLGASLWPTRRALVASLSLAVMALSLWPFGGATGALGLLASVFLTFLGGLSLAAFLSRAFGGLTGDCCGAICEASEALLLLSLYLLR